MDVHIQLAEKIIREQESIVGPLAWEQARKVAGLKVDMEKQHISLEGNKSDIIEKLIEQYRNLFGQASVDVCREASRDLISQIPQDQIPPLLR